MKDGLEPELSIAVDVMYPMESLTRAAAQSRKTQSAVLSGGLFSVAQARTGKDKGIATFTLLEDVFRGAPSKKSCAGPEIF